MNRFVRTFPVACIVLSGLFVLTACGNDDATTEPPATVEPTSSPTTGPDATATPLPEPSPTPEPTAAATATADPTATTAPQPTATATPTPSTAAEVVLNVYWVASIDTTPGGSPERIAAGGRVSSTTSPAQAALEALLAGPDALESEIGMTSSIPGGTRLLDLAVRDRTATVDLSSEFEEGSGTLAETLRVAQVVFTLTQFDTIDTVAFRIDGEDREFLASHGIDVSRPVDRGDFENVRPFILVERPYPGARFQSGDTLTGESNTFEATVEYVVTDAEGLIIAEGFTTATGGNGIWGRFTVPVVLDSEAAGRGAMIVFETSARDGSQINLVEYPIVLVGA